MKKSITVFFIGLIAVFLLADYCYAQPEGFMYQAEIRNDKEKILTNTSISLDIRILEQVADVDSWVWQRIYKVTTDKYGMVSLIVGDENPPADQTKLFKDIAWGNVNHYLYIELNDGSGWVSMGDPVMLMSVPYALYAKSAGNTSSGAYYYFDKDNDTYGDKSNPVWKPDGISIPEGFVNNSEDCDDSDAGVHPGAEEIPEDGIDQNCDGIETYLDKDKDGYTSDVDCDDNNANVNPGAEEICWDGIDNNCDGNLDEECELDCRVELIGLFDCVNEYCGGLADLTCIQNNCGRYLNTYNLCVDMGCVIELSGSINETWSSEQKADYILASCSKEDVDGDGVSVAEGDCNDNDATVYPGATETCNNGKDEDCDGRDAVCGDDDGDGFASIINGGTDCDDNNAEVYPGAEEICDGVDNDCDGIVDNLANNPNATREYTYYEDADRDGFGNPEVYVVTCNPPLDYVQNSDDCDDTNAEIFPGQIWYPDCDNDGYFSQEGIISCSVPALPCANGEYTGEFNHVSGDDCDDEDATVHPGAEEICGNVIDENCDGNVDEGFSFDTDVTNCGTCGEVCGPAWAWICVAGLCEALDTDNDNVPDILEDVNGNNNPWDDDTDDDGIANIEDDDDDGDDIPTFEEVNWTGNGEPGDADHDGFPDYLDDDSDNDGFKAGGTDVSYENIDCNDWDERINPAAVEICNGYDDNCDGTTDEGCIDADGDTYRGIDGDCDDNDPTVYPGAQEICDGKDNNCNTVIDDINPIKNTCGFADYLGAISGDTGSDLIQVNDNGDTWLRVLVTEDASSLLVKDLKLSCHLNFPNDADYDIELFLSCSSGLLVKSDSSTPSTPGETVSYSWTDFPGSDQSAEVLIHIKFVSGSACAQWSLQILGNL